MKIIDIHIHGGLGVNFNTSSCEEIKNLLKELKKRNITAICPTLVGDETAKLRERFKLFKKIKQDLKNDEAYIIGLHLEGTFLNPQKPGIQDAKVFMRPCIENFKKLTEGFEDIIKIVTLAPELDENGSLSNYLEERNIRAHAGHTLGNYKGNTSATTHHFNAMPPISHRGKNLALDCLLDSKTYCEIIADGIHTSDNMLKLFFKVKDKSKIIMISDALPAAGYNREVTFCSKKILPSGKDENGTIAGSVMFLDEIIKSAVKRNIISLDDAEKYAFLNPLQHLNLSPCELEKIKN